MLACGFGPGGGEFRLSNFNNNKEKKLDIFWHVLILSYFLSSMSVGGDPRPFIGISSGKGRDIAEGDRDKECSLS